MYAHFFDSLATQLRQHTSLRTISFDMRRLSTGNYRYPALFIELSYGTVVAPQTKGTGLGRLNLGLTLVTAPLPTLAWATPPKAAKAPKNATANATAPVSGVGRGLAHLAVLAEIQQALQYFQSADWTGPAYRAWAQQTQDPATALTLGGFVTLTDILPDMSPLAPYMLRKLNAWGVHTSLSGTVQLPTPQVSGAQYVNLTDVAVKPG